MSTGSKLRQKYTVSFLFSFDSFDAVVDWVGIANKAYSQPCEGDNEVDFMEITTSVSLSFNPYDFVLQASLKLSGQRFNPCEQGNSTV
ncbi:hypothetical protein [Streptococcus merionis]|uniref:hypothetical protein n=1 Tax=Streptococcus merionis TaxID=400065 RepID=UPI0026F0FD31|nr:hypothetical protein [Streptococcus merionis]